MALASASRSSTRSIQIGRPGGVHRLAPVDDPAGAREAVAEGGQRRLRPAQLVPRSGQRDVEGGVRQVRLAKPGEVTGGDAVAEQGGELGRARQDQLSQACSEGSGSKGRPPSYQPGSLHSSKWRWQPLALPVSPTAPMRWPVYTRSPARKARGLGEVHVRVVHVAFRRRRSPCSCPPRRDSR